ncbi:PulJ/GspJ family protein [Fluviispira multicolorata]|uniref:Prepilin-type N-terminal cleavage/methylation domain-containing protein n=1 Tax=Fluviispira multicolorata TaxID=2654512 RepID=A0A833JG94_9BACT|nr:prepilin-type N-terminal cleavage/methylation domain-containing protein [Fluviispira multicolorata]KAB8031996.1 prepilin-type N-terminal cleavage/methylation domain-containing protein [Fluviispira multicolorata]
MFKSQHGFSLLEIILALSILATLSVLTINILTTQLNTREKVTDYNSQKHAMNMAMKKIYEDLQSAYISDQNYTAALNLGARQIIPQLYYRNKNLVFSTSNYKSYIANSTQSNLAFVRYFVRTDPGNSTRNQLMRVVDTNMSDSIERDEVGLTEVLNPDIKEFKVQFWNGSDYREEWDSTANDTQNKLPKLVKIHLEAYFPESALEKQLRDTNSSSQQNRKTLALDTIVYIMSTNGVSNVINPSGNYKWQ